MEHCYKTFVSIGNGKQSFFRLLSAVEENIELLPKPILIQRGHTSFESKYCDMVDFVSMDEFLNLVQNVQLLILHAGAGSVINAIKAKKIPIVMPRLAKYDEVVNDHQVGFAKLLQDEKKIIMVENSEQLAIAIEKLLKENNNKLIQDIVSRASEVIKHKLEALFD